jgi:hypothetical protein
MEVKGDLVWCPVCEQVKGPSDKEYRAATEEESTDRALTGDQLLVHCKPCGGKVSDRLTQYGEEGGGEDLGVRGPR